MIDPAYVQTMAKYNRWQNTQMSKVLLGTSTAVLTLNRRAFFSSIFGTLNHLLWGDRLWMSRFDPTLTAPKVGVAESVALTKDIRAWNTERKATDRIISDWARDVRAVTLRSNLTFHSITLNEELERPLAQCVSHFFNHQTHHRGQIHAMMTAAGLDAPVSDLILMPEDI